jgi:hypothetical protein
VWVQTGHVSGSTADWQRAFDTTHASPPLADRKHGTRTIDAGTSAQSVARTNPSASAENALLPRPALRNQLPSSPSCFCRGCAAGFLGVSGLSDSGRETFGSVDDCRQSLCACEWLHPAGGSLQRGPWRVTTLLLLGPARRLHGTCLVFSNEDCTSQLPKKAVPHFTPTR